MIDQQLIIYCTLVFAGTILGSLIIHMRYINNYANFNAEKILLEAVHKRQENDLNQLKQKIQEKEDELLHLSGELSSAKVSLQQLDYWRAESKHLSNQLQNQLEINKAQQADLREANIRLEETIFFAEEKERLIVSTEQRLNTQFENLANRIFESNGRRVDEQNRQSLNSIINPLREQIDGFKQHINDSFSQEARERHTMSHEIRQLQKLNAQMAQEAINLTKALKGDNKAQGNWGEVILSRVLESSGLRKGYEYETQVSVQLEDQRRVQPDVIVHLPNAKDVIIDAKMSLLAYERYFNAQDDIIREKALQNHVDSIRNHIKLLGQKDYQQLPGLRSLDYVLMFIPIEPAFLLAIDHQPDLLNEALQKNIMLVSPTTLLVALRTISNLWRYENQSRNAQRIADRATRMYDKMRLFVNDMISIGHNLDKAQQSYNLSMKKLVEGRGNIIAQIETFRSLGVEIKRPIDPQILSQAYSEKAYANSDELFSEEKAITLYPD